MIDRSDLYKALQDRLGEVPAVALLGARQVGKTTLAQTYATRFECAYFDLEDPQSLASLDQPQAVLQSLLAQGKTIVMDEVQRRPDLFPLLRTLIDRHQRNGQFLLLGSASQRCGPLPTAGRARAARHVKDDGRDDAQTHGQGNRNQGRESG